MKSSSGTYFIGLDHIRALAAFMVFTWHFNHVHDGHLAGPAPFPLSILAQGHVGVALFMSLSGYLFARLLEGRGIRFLPFLWNRAIRLFPLLFLVFAVLGLERYLAGEPLRSYLGGLVYGFIYPYWPNGGWSIAVELHFYVILPLLLAISARHPLRLLGAVGLALVGRFFWWLETGEIQSLAYWTIVGCFDQFVLGIFACRMRHLVVHRHGRAMCIALGLLVFIHVFDRMGGFYTMGGYPTSSMIWVYYPTVLGGGFAFLIAWYDGSFRFSDRGLSGMLAQIGACSYSIYLWHSFVVFDMAKLIDTQLIALNHLGVVLLFSTLSFLCILPFAMLSTRLIELPPMRYRLSYLRPQGQRAGPVQLRA